ncbi:MAG: hypothetical protein V7765_01875 [Oleispira sp.]
MNVVKKPVSGIKKSLVGMLVMAVIIVIVMLNFNVVRGILEGILNDSRAPKLLESGEYQIYTSDYTQEQWDHPDFLDEPRLNFTLKRAVDKSDDSIGYRVESEVGIYSMRLNGTDFRTVLSASELKELQGSEWSRSKRIGLMKRSHDNRYIAFTDDDAYNQDLFIIDLEEKTSEKVGSIKRGQFSWMLNENKVVFLDSKYKLSVYDFESKEIIEIGGRFRSTKSIKRFEYYADLNKIIIFNSRANVHNFRTGGLLERSPKEYYYGSQSSHPLYRMTQNKYNNNYSTKGTLSFYRQGEPRDQVELKYSMDRERQYVDFGPEKIYSLKSGGVQLDAIYDKTRRLYRFGKFWSARALSLTNFTLENYSKYNCNIYRTRTSIEFDFCDSNSSWDHSKKRLPYGDEIHMAAKSYEFNESNRIAEVDKIIEYKTNNESSVSSKYYEKYKVAEADVSIEEATAMVEDISTLYSQSEYLKVAMSIMALKNNTKYMAVNSEKNSSVLSADQLIHGLSFFDINEDLPNVAMQCFAAADNPIRFLSESYYLGAIDTNIHYGRKRNDIRESITDKLNFLVPALVKNGLKPLAKELVEEAHSFGSDLVTYTGKRNTREFMRIYDLVGDAERLKHVVRNVREEAGSYKYNTKEYRVKHAKELASYYLFQGKKEKAYKLLNIRSEGEGVLSTINSGEKRFEHPANAVAVKIPEKEYWIEVVNDGGDGSSIIGKGYLELDDLELRQAFDGDNRLMPSKKYWVKIINDGGYGYRYGQHKYTAMFNKLLHDYGEQGVRLANEVFPLYLSNHLISEELLLNFKLHYLQHVVEIDKSKYPKLLEEVVKACEQDKCGSRYSDMSTLALLRRIYQELGDEKLVAHYTQKMAALEEGSIVNISAINASDRSVYYYQVLDEVASAEEVINHLETFGGNPEVFKVLVKVHNDGRNEKKHMAYLKQIIDPKFWDGMPGLYFQEILPELTQKVQRDQGVINKLANTSCGLLFSSYFNDHPEDLSKISTIF